MLALSRRCGESIQCSGGGVDILFTYRRPTRSGVLITIKEAGSAPKDIDLPIGITAQVGEVRILPVWSSPHKSRLGFEAPDEVKIMRTELLTAKGMTR